VSAHGRAYPTNSWERALDYNEWDVYGLDWHRERKKESLSHCCSWNGGICRRPMCLIRRWEETRGHTCLGIAEEVKQIWEVEGNHAAASCKQVADNDGHWA